MNNVTVTILTTMAGTVFGWLLAQIKLGSVKVLVKEKIDHIFYRNDDIGEVSEYSNGKFDSIRMDMRLIISNSKEQKIALRDFEATFYSKNGKVIESVPLKDTSTTTHNSYGIEAKEAKCVIIDAGSSVDMEVFCFLNDYNKAKKVESIRVKYLNSKLKEKSCWLKRVSYSDLKEYRSQEE